MSAAAAAPGPGARPWLARLHPALFGIALGTLGLAGAWQRLVPLGVTRGNPVSLALFAAGLAVLGVLAVLWAAKLVRHPAVVRQEWHHPVQGPLLAILPVALLLATALAAPAFPSLRAAWLTLTCAALLMQGLLAWQVVARLSTGQMPPELITPALYLPTVAGGFVGSMTLNALALPGWGALLMGMGAGAWALLEIRILNRLFAGPLPPLLRPTLGLEIAPAAVGSLALASLWPGLPAEALMVCLGVASAPVMAVLTRWRYWTEVPFNPGFWSFSFPLAAMAGATVEAVRRGGWPVEVAVAAVAIASAVIAYLAVRTLVLLLRGRLLPPQ
ncbi:MAG: hypothetical protein JNM90_10695 [Burkholderiales bacterium]|nr:hypothetical protein [Burkholderiales bacterium]